MSRSRKKVSCNSAPSGCGKEWKRFVNKSLRARAKQLINSCKDWDELMIPIIDECGDIYDSHHDHRWIEWTKPDNDECWRDWYSHCYYGLNGASLADIIQNNGHYLSGKNGRPHRWGECECLTNKNNYYWRRKRK